ncbi:hypothetical protein BGZ70_000346 [Mortierella alpina]|uniref:XPG-I domain-containing protein n=1 Tax=Mortierella alpina TaxID=64518 RepID=A0A9P6IY09_MORAP|nr:hypothetical protein BGZ70_000346 [Mortierella alpina]
MGVAGAFLYLDQKGITGEEVELEDIDEKIHVDDCAEQLASCLSYKLKQLGFRPGQSKLHFDGSSTIQKTKARDKRARDDVDEVQSVRSLVDKTTQAIRSLALLPTPVNRARKEKILRAAKTAMRSFKSAKVMDKGFIQALVEAMSDEWSVHVCRGEADVCIARQGQIAVATTDSDLLFHSVKSDPHDRTKFRRYKTAEILKKLTLTPDMWTVAAVVSNNDYSEHVKGCGLLTNVEIIKSIGGAKSMNKNQLLVKYCTQVKRSRKVPGLTPERFLHATSIFFSRHQDFVNEPQCDSGLDREIAEMINMVQIFKRDYNAQRQGHSPQPLAHDGQSEAGSTLSQQPQPLAHDVQTMELDEDQSEAGSTLSQQQRRPHLAFMSSNQFKITTYNKTPGAMIVDASSSPAPRRKKKKPQKRKAKTLYNPSSRRARLAQPDTSEFSTVSLDCGTLAAQVAAAIQQNEVGDDDDRASLAKTVTLMIQEMVFIGNEAMRCVQQAIACYFAEVIAEHCTLSPVDIKRRQEKFTQFSKFRNNAFFTNLLQDVFRWHDDADQSTRGRPRKETDANACIKDILGVNSAYRRALTKANKTVPFLKRTLTGGLTHFFEQCGVRLADQFQCHFLRNTAELVQRLKTENPAWVAGGEGKAVIASINIKQGTSSKHDQLSLF